MLRAEDLIAPSDLYPDGKGDLEPYLFPEKTPELSLNKLIAKVNGLLTQAQTEIQPVASAFQDKAAFAFVHWQIFAQVCQSMYRTPNSTSLDSGKTTVSFTDEQRKFFVEERDRWEYIFKDYLPKPEELPLRSGSIKMKVRI